MDFKEMVEKIKNQIRNGQITYGQVIGEMNITPEVIAAEMEEVKTALEAKETLDKVKEALGVSGEMDVVEVAKEGRKAIDESKKKNFEDTVNKIIGEKVSGEMAQGLVKKMLNIEEGASEEVIAGEIDKILADEFIQKALSDHYIDKGTGVGSTSQTETSSGLVTKRAQI